MESGLTGRWISPKNALFNEKIPFLGLANSGYENRAGQAKRKNNLDELSVEKNFAEIATHTKDRLWIIAKPTRKSEFHPGPVFSAWALPPTER